MVCTTTELKDGNLSNVTSMLIPMFMKLDDYIQGGNNAGVVSKLNIPVFHFIQSNNEGMMDKITMCFWLTQSNQVFVILGINSRQHNNAPCLVG